METLSGRNILIYFYAKYKGDWAAIYKAVSTKEEVDIDKFDKYVEAITSKHEVITLVDDNYPEVIRQSYHPPFVLTFDSPKIKTMLAEVKKGKIVTLLEDCENEPSIFGVIGTKNNHSYTARVSLNVLDIRRGDSHIGQFSTFDPVQANHLSTCLCRQALAIEGNPSFNFNIGLIVQNGGEIYALPGKSGCACNKMIKEGIAFLCDCPEDLISEIEKDIISKEEE